VFVQELLPVARPFDQLAPRFVAPGWLHPLAITAVGQAFQSVRGSSGTLERSEITLWPEAINYELGPVRVRSDGLSIPMRWSSRLDHGLFPRRFDGDLQAARVDADRSELTVVGTFPRPLTPSAAPGMVRESTEAWTRHFLALVARSLLADPPPGGAPLTS
jgi:hypothetical protein